MDVQYRETRSRNARLHTCGEKESSVRINILVFARGRDLTGLTDLPLVVPKGSTTQDCLKKLVAKFPSLEEIRSCMVHDLTEKCTNESAIVKDKDELDIVPLISGG